MINVDAFIGIFSNNPLWLHEASLICELNGSLIDC